MRNSISIIFITLILLFGFSKSTWAFQPENVCGKYVNGYIDGVIAVSSLAVFTLIAVCPDLERIKNENCLPHLTDKCNFVKNLLLEANLSWQGFVGGVGGVLMFSLMTSLSSVEKADELRYIGFRILLGIGAIISHVSGLVFDFGLWNRWDQIKQSKNTDSILIGSIVNGVLHLIPYLGLLGFGLVESILHLRAAHSPDSEN